MFLEESVYSSTRAASERRAREQGCRHFPVRTFDEQRDFPSGGKNMVNGAQQRSSAETPLEATLGRIQRLSENELHRRNEGRRQHAMEYTKDFYKVRKGKNCLLR